MRAIDAVTPLPTATTFSLRIFAATDDVDDDDVFRDVDDPDDWACTAGAPRTFPAIAIPDAIPGSSLNTISSFPNRSVESFSRFRMVVPDSHERGLGRRKRGTFKKSLEPRQLARNLLLLEPGDILSLYILKMLG